MGVVNEISSVIRDMYKRAQAPGYIPMTPSHAVSVSNQAKDIGAAAKKTWDVVNDVADRGATAAAMAPLGAVYGAASGAYDGVRQNGWKSFLPGTDAFSDTAGKIGRGAVEYGKFGGKLGWREAPRVRSDIANAAVSVADMLGGDVFKGLTGDAAKRVGRWSDDQLLESIRRSGVEIPENIPRDIYTGKMMLTGDPRYEEFDRFLAAQRHGQDWAQAALLTGVGGMLHGAVASRLPSVPAMPKAMGLIDKAKNIAKVAPAKAGRTLASLTPEIPWVSSEMSRAKREAGRAEDGSDALALLKYIEATKKLDPSSERYAKNYAALQKLRGRYPLYAYEELPKPTWNPRGN